MLMAAEVLRRASALLRERAAGAVVPGPWEYRDQRDDPEVFPWQVWAPEARFSAGTGFCPGAAEYIALMHPPVALALADWLDSEAISAEDMTGALTARLVTVDRDATEANAFALARAILREES